MPALWPSQSNTKYISPSLPTASYLNLVLLCLTAVMEVLIVCFLLFTLESLPVPLESKSWCLLATRNAKRPMKQDTDIFPFSYSCYADHLQRSLHLWSNGISCKLHIWQRAHPDGTLPSQGMRYPPETALQIDQLGLFLF